MTWAQRVSMVVLAASLVGCSDFVTGEGAAASGDGDSSSTGRDPASTTTSDSTTAATDSAESTATSAGPPTTDPDGTSSNTNGDTTADPTTDASSSSGSSASTGSDSSSTAESDSDPTTGPMLCEQQDTEPNDLENDGEFVSLGSVSCGPTQYAFSGTIEDELDEDWLGFVGDWDCGGPEDPQVLVDVEGNNVEVCVSPQCIANATAVYSCAEGDNWMLGGNDFGCCSSDVVRMNVDCAGVSNESLVASIRVRDAEAVCEDYALSYAFLVQ